MKTLVNTDPGGAGRNFTDELTSGQQAGSWIVERELGRGGMGIVYAVVHEKIGKRAALKVLHRSLLVPGFNAQRMELEGRAVNEIGHPNIVDIFEAGAMPDGRPYIVMERLDGQSLATRVETEIATEEVFGILLQVCDALIAAHAAGVVHRDLKLDNIFLLEPPEQRGVPRVKLLDWGIARMIHVDARHTMEGQLVGTPQYVSPEQARGAEVTVQTDVYSLGVVAYELFAGQLPFEGSSAAEMMAKHLLVPPPPPSAFWPRIPPTLEELLLAMLAKRPEERPTISQVARRLEEARTELEERRDEIESDDTIIELRIPKRTTADDSVVELRRPRRPRWPAVAGGLALLGAAGLFVLAREPGAVDEPEPPAPPSAQSPELSVSGTSPQEPPPRPRTSPEAVVNPVHVSCADPAIVRDGSQWIMTCTGGRSGNHFPIYQAPDLRSWSRVAWIFPEGAQPTWANGNTWAPELHRTDEGVTAVFSMRRIDGKNAIGVATAASMLGPFTDLGTPLHAPRQGASDAHLFLDATARYLYYRLDDEPTSIWVQPLLDRVQRPRR